MRHSPGVCQRGDNALVGIVPRAGPRCTGSSVEPDRLDILMAVAIALWENGRYRPFDEHEIRELDAMYGTGEQFGLQARRGLAWRTRGDLEWTVLVVPALTMMLDAGTGEFGGEWPVRTVTAAVALRVLKVEEHADDWAAGSEPAATPLLELLACARLPGSVPGSEYGW